jgi:hypothetical protein
MHVKSPTYKRARKSLSLGKLKIHIAVLPQDLLQEVLCKLEFRDKINAGQVCKQWDQLLRTGTPATRHWVVDYNIDTIVSSRAYTTTAEGLVAQRFTTYIERYVTHALAT